MATKVTDPKLLAELEGGGGGPVTDPAILAQLDAPPVGRGQALAQGAAQGATFGWSDEIQGALAAGGRGEREPASIYKLIPGLWRMFQGDPEAKAKYEAARNTARDETEAARTSQPGYFLGGQLAGGLATAAPLAPLSTGATVAGTVGRGVASGAVLGGLQGAGDAAETADIPRDAAIGAGVGGVVGGAVPLAIQGVRRALTPTANVDPSRRVLVEALRNEGVDLTAGQQTGSKFVRYLESAANDMPFVGGGVDDMLTRQKEQFTSAALRRAGVNADRAEPAVMDAARDNIGRQFADLSARNTLTFDQQFAADLTNTVRNYGRALPVNQREYVADLINDLGLQNGQLPGRVYQETRSRLTRMAQNNRNSDPTFAEALRGIRDALDNAMERSVSPADAGAWGEARRLYGNYKTISNAMAGAGEETAQGLLSPLQLRQAVAAGNKDGYVRGQGELAELARAGAGVMTPLPQSGTAPRMMAQQILTGLAPAAIGAGAGGYSTGDMAGAVTGAAAGAGVARALLSPAGQAYLSNQLLPGAGGMNRRVIEALLAAPARQQSVERLNGR